MNITAPIKKALPAVLGATAANFVSNKLSNFIGNDKLRGAALFVGGLLLMNNRSTEMVGLGVTVSAGTKLLGSFIPALAGYDDLNFSTDDMGAIVNGPYDGGDYSVAGSPQDVVSGAFSDDSNEDGF